MIYTVTCNPALDCTLTAEEWQAGGRGVVSPGGKGVNVSRVLTVLGVDNRALGFIAGDNGRALEESLKKMGVQTDFIVLPEGETRVNVKICGPAEIEKNGEGVPLTEEAIVRLERQLTEWVNPDDAVCLCGSLPPQTAADTYARLVRHLRTLGVTRIVVDTGGEALKAALSQRPWLIKPNDAELAAAVGRDLPTADDVVAAAKELMVRGAENVLVSMGGDGAVLLTADGEVRRQPAPHGEVVGTVGAGDSTVAGFIAQYGRTADWDAALRFGVACGSATAFSDGLADAVMIEKVKQSL